jgi:pyruvate/2-oxoglutarate dehydrogenase complex dihydrolipoamide dehydrogenase (E3) component
MIDVKETSSPATPEAGARAQVFDAIIIGTGQAAPALAVGLAKRGERVAVIEAALVGGSCVNVGCTPTKTLRKSARVAHLARVAHEFGVQVGEVRVDFAAAMARMRLRVETARAGLEAWIGGQPNIRLVRAWGSLAGRQGEHFVVMAGEERLLAGRVYLNTGTRAFIPPIAGLDALPYLDNVRLLALTERPEHLLVLGGSYIGLEMGQIFRRLGARVSVIEPNTRVAAREDPEVSAAITDFLQQEGVSVHCGSGVERAEATADGKGICLTLAGGRQLTGSHLLVATGRLPNTERLNLASVGLETDSRGFIPTDGALRTAVAGIWALGDINRRGAFTHTSYDDFEIALAERRGDAGPAWRSADERILAYAMFTDPPLGRVGITLEEARQLVRQGRRILYAKWAMKDVSRAKEESETFGLITLIVDAATERLLGATFLGINGDEIVQVISSFMATGASWRVLQQVLPVHPTVTEFLPTILGQLKPLEIA